jgi:hypothetical protein
MTRAMTYHADALAAATAQVVAVNVALLRVLYARTRSPRLRAWSWDGSPGSAACSATPGSGWLKADRVRE